MKFVSESADFFANAPADICSQALDVDVVQWAGHQQKNWKKCIAVDDSANPDQVVSAILENSVNHFVQKNDNHFWPELKYSLPIAASPEVYFRDGARALAAENGQYHSVRFASPEDKPSLKDQVSHFTSQVESLSVIQAVDIVVEELYMNAILDAPREALKQGLALSHYKDQHAAQVELYLSGSRLIVNCSDPFGALDVNKFLKRMDEVYRKGAGEVINLKGGGGAGLGCVLMFEQCLSMFLGVQAGQKTLVTCVIPVGMSNRNKMIARKSLHRIQI